jgi:hypothetical protein
MEGLLTMSVNEVDRLKIISQIEKKILTVEEGSEDMADPLT